MISAVDSSVLLDVITDSPHADASEAALRRVSQEGSLIVCECVLAEVRPALRKDQFAEFMQDWQLRFVPASIESALLAGDMFTLYLQRKGMAKRVVADFLIGAHATVHASRLLARDRGYMRDYFSELTVLSGG